MTLRDGIVQSLKNNRGDWNNTLLNEMFGKESVHDICNIFLASTEKEGHLIWLGNKNITEVSLPNSFTSLRIRGGKTSKNGGEKCGITSYMRDISFFYKNLPTKDSVLRKTWSVVESK